MKSLWITVGCFVGLINISNCEHTTDLKSTFVNPKMESENYDQTDTKIIQTENNEMPFDNKNMAKRRTYLTERNDQKMKSVDSQERFMENHEYISRINDNVNHNEAEKKTFNTHDEDYNWEVNRDRFLDPGLGYSHDVPNSYSNQMINERPRYEWEGPGNFLEEKKFYSNDNRTSKIHSNGWNTPNYNRDLPMVPDYRSNMKKFMNDNQLLGSMHASHHGQHASITIPRKNKYYGIHNTEHCGVDKGLIINFNAGCPPVHPHNKLVHKFIFAPKSHSDAYPGVSSFQIPKDSISSSHVGSPLYYI